MGFNAVFNIDNITYTVNKNRLRIEGRSVISQKTFTLSKEDQLYLKTDTFWKSHFYIGDICYIDNIIYTAEKRRLHFQRRISYISKDVYAIKGGSVISQKTFTHSNEDQLYHKTDTFWKSPFYIGDTYVTLITSHIQ